MDNRKRSEPEFSSAGLCQSLFLNKVAGLRPATLLKKRLCCRRFPVNFFNGTPLGDCFLTRSYLLKMVKL